MKPGIHPEYVIAAVTCACGNNFQTRATRPEIKLEICSQCHPHYTGITKMLDTAGRVERFQKRFAKTEGKMVERDKIVKVVKAVAISTKTKPKLLATTPTKKEEKKAAKTAKKA